MSDSFCVILGVAIAVAAFSTHQYWPLIGGAVEIFGISAFGR